MTDEELLELLKYDWCPAAYMDSVERVRAGGSRRVHLNPLARATIKRRGPVQKHVQFAHPLSIHCELGCPVLPRGRSGSVGKEVFDGGEALNVANFAKDRHPQVFPNARGGAAAEAIELPPPQAVQGEEFSLVIRVDGWMVRRRGPDWGAGTHSHAPERVQWKEVKSAVIYRLQSRVENASGRGLLVEKYVVAAPPETSPLDFGAEVQAEARRRGLAQARKVYIVIDGALWLWNLAKERFSQAELLLDFHHASEYLWALADDLHGQGSTEARTWVEGLLHSLRHGCEAQVVESLEELLFPKTPLVEPVPESFRGPIEYFRNHRDHLHYQRNADQGAPVGSGSVESLCSQLQNRFKRAGQFWSPDGLRLLLKLDVLVRNDDFNCLWN